MIWEGITLTPEPSVGIDRGRRVTLYGRGLPESLRGRVVDVRTATGLMLGGRIGDAEVKKRRGHIEGYGLVWGASKSVSLLLAVLDDAQRQALLQRFDDAVRRAIDDTEQWLWVRRGAGGKKIERVSGGLFAYAIHATSGRGDPHLHAHILLRAVGRCEDGAWRTIDSDSALDIAKKILDARIARYLQGALAEIGIYTRERVVGTVPTLEIPDLEPLVPHFSARSLDVRAKEDKGRGWRNALRAWYESRRGLNAEALEHAMDAEVLQETEIGRAIIATWQQRLRDCNPNEAIRQTRLETQKLTLEAMLDHAGDIVRMSDLLAFEAYRHDDCMSDSALGEIEQIINSRMVNGIEGWQATLLGYRAGTVRDRRALYHVLGKGGMLVQAEGMRQTRVIEGMWRKMLSDERRVQVTVATSDGLSDEQQEALRIIESGRRAVLVVGTAGAGKSQVLERVLTPKYVITRNAVLGHDLSGRVGGRWATLARADALFREIKERDARGEHSVVVVDEGSLVDRADWLRVLWHIRELRHTQLIVLGDQKQIESIDRTHIFRLLVERARSTDGYAELHVSRRTQEWEYEHRALRHMPREVAAIREFLRAVHKRGGIVLDRADPYRRTAELVAEGLKQGKAYVAIVARNEDAVRISVAVQQARGITPVQDIPLMDGQRCGVGDVVRLRQNNYELRVFNGMTGVVLEVTPGGVRVRLSDDRMVTLSAAYCREAVQLGYASTADSAQGLTVEQAIVMVDGMDYRRTYVAATRSRRPPVYVASSAQAIATALATRDEHAPPRTAADILCLPRVAQQEDRWKGQGISVQ